MTKRTHIVALSGGKDSTAMALRLVETEPRDYEWVCTPTGNELPEMVDHWLRLGRLLGSAIKPVTSGQSLGGLIRRQQALPNWRMRWCTRMLKIEPFAQYVMTKMPCTVYVGLRADEADRDGMMYKSSEVVQRFPLVEWGWSLEQVRAYLRKRNIEIPRRTDCAACFFQTLGEWYQLYREHPARYQEAEKWEEMTGHTLRSPQRDTWPAALRLLRREFERGRIPKRRAGMESRKQMCAVCAR